MISNYLPISLKPIKIEPAISNFVVLIQSKKEIKANCMSKSLATWLNSALPKFSEIGEYQRFISPALELEQLNDPLAVQIRMKTAMLYANVLGQYVPEDDGHIDRCAFNYIHLVKVIKKVFYHHIQSNVELFGNGIRLKIKNESFLAIVAKSVSYIVHEKELGALGKGGHGTVIAVHELVSSKILAFKYSTSCERLKREFDNLNKLHERATFLNVSVEGFQEAPFAYFEIQDGLIKLAACLELRYDISLFDWIHQVHTNAERIAMCKRLARAYKNKHDLGYWHGDIKPENVLIKGNTLAIIDWEGSFLFKDLKLEKKVPLASTADYLNIEDKMCMEDVMSHRYNTPILREQLREAGESSELFSLGLTFFIILTGRYPFEQKAQFPDTRKGLPLMSVKALIDRSYGIEIVNVMNTMLSHFSKDRYSTADALLIWEQING